ncbi:hypothetical protein CEP54_015704 [Fusarium duplospermum]|uniref:glucan endo-1,3-beta-D-glucosidase n=1 Tax=Fusarium duplospermum TaxID=1325734 RepID=A0A428NM12_9HYPO|nr:hypothetical protein CEP54_015704 [Fusarium duplospermum]
MKGVNIKDALRLKTFQNSYWDVKRRVNQVHPKIEIWVGETGWPTKGANYKGAAATTAALQSYYNNVGCWLWKQTSASAFWFTAFDAPLATPEVEKHFGIADSNRKLKFEDIYVGYRFYEAVKRSTLQEQKDGRELLADVGVENTGPVDDTQVVQVYVAARSSSIRRQAKELDEFSKVIVEAGEM